MKHKLPPRVFVDADVLFAGSATTNDYSASMVVLRMAEITLVEAVTSEQVVTEVERNLEQKLPQALPVFRLLLSRCLEVVPDPTAEELRAHVGKADAKDLPILIAASREKCPRLVTFNVRHFQPGLPDVSILRPGQFVLQARERLSGLQ